MSYGSDPANANVVGDSGQQFTDAPPVVGVTGAPAKRDQITAAMDQRGLTAAEDAAEIALRTRKAKQAQPRDQLLTAWTEKARAAGFDLTAMVSAARAAGAVQKAPLDAPAAVSAAVGRLSESEAVFRHAENRDIQAAIEQAKQSGRLHETTPNGRRAWTATGANEQERQVLETVRAVSRAGTAVAGGEHPAASHPHCYYMIADGPDSDTNRTGIQR